ncbi:hypothetical protein B0H14DRAFT_2926675 [Mycena olivaceomarginata]|nr:hypothetical protein B0H14DRAFT_2926675 [Mycena olivaceomarginata]
MCLLLPFFHRCWDWNPDLDIIFPAVKRIRSIQFYTQSFFLSIRRTWSIADTDVTWVAYCRTRGPTGYPFLLISLRYANHRHHSILMKLEGDDSHEKTPVLTIGRVDTTVRGVVGTWRYDVYQTVVFPYYPSPPKLGDFLALVDLANTRDCTQAAFPVTVYCALKTLFDGTVSSSTKRRLKKSATLANLDVADEMKRSVINAFPARQQRMQEEIKLRCYGIVEVDKCAHDIDAQSGMDLESALARVASLEKTVSQLQDLLINDV